MDEAPLKTPSELPQEVWAHIVWFLERPKPRIGTEKWKDLHQQDLTVMMRVSRVTAPLLYREPIIENVWSFLQCSDLDKTTPSKSSTTVSRTSHEDIDSLTSKAICYQHTQKVHIVLTEDDFHSFSYSSLFFVSTPNELNRYWQYVTMFETYDNTTPDTRDAIYCSTKLMESYYHSLQNLFRSAQSTPTHCHLRPKGISFGTYGDLSWNDHQLAINKGFDHDIVSSSIRAARKAREEAEARKGWMTETIVDVSVATRLDWGKYELQTHCTRFMGGPLGTAHTPILFWPYLSTGDIFIKTDSIPPINWIHSDTHTMAPWSITIGSPNVIIFHPLQGYDTWTNEAAMEHMGMGMKTADMMAEDLSTQGFEDQVAETTIDIYYPFQVIGGKGSGKLVKAAQKALDKELTVMKGKIKIYSYYTAPSCPTCGWTIADDQEQSGNR